MAEEPVEPIKQLKTTIIKASIHCQGCKRKVKKILSQIHGVEHVDVDAEQHKVTVTGNVDADTLIKKLIKSGKNAQLWPQISQHKINPANGDQRREKEKEIETHGKVDGADNNGKTVAEASKKAETPAPVKAANGGGGGDAKAKAEVNGASVKKTSGDVKVNVNAPVKKSEEEENKSEESCSAAPEKKEAAEKSNGGGEGAEIGASAKKKKKKKKRGQSPNPDGGLENREAGPPPATNESPPRHHHHHFPPPAAAQPVCAVSYNTAYPSSSYTASHYAAPPPHAAYAYMHQMEAPPLDPDQLNQRQPLDSFEMFSDENPNGCFIM